MTLSFNPSKDFNMKKESFIFYFIQTWLKMTGLPRKNQINIGIHADAQADLSLRWVRMSFC